MHAFLLPPLNLFLLLAFGLLLRRRCRRIGGAAAGISLGLLILACMPIVAGSLLRSLERYPALDVAGPLDDADAIVVLGADIRYEAPEFVDGAVGALTLERLRYAASLQRRSQLPVLVTGGVLRAGHAPVAQSMRSVLETELGCQVRWVEPHAGNTIENADRSAAMLEQSGIGRIYLVTHAWHMRRALACFEAQGLEVVPAPTVFRAAPRPDMGDFLPSSKALRQCALALHEYFGLVWYRMRYL